MVPRRTAIRNIWKRSFSARVRIVSVFVSNFVWIVLFAYVTDIFLTLWRSVAFCVVVLPAGIIMTKSTSDSQRVNVLVLILVPEVNATRGLAL